MSDSNYGFLVPEATALPTEPQPPTPKNHVKFVIQYIVGTKNHAIKGHYLERQLAMSVANIWPLSCQGPIKCIWTS